MSEARVLGAAADGRHGISDLAERDAVILRLHGEGMSRAGIVEALAGAWPDRISKDIVANVVAAARRGLAPVRPQGIVASYEAMLSAIAACKAADEAKDIADRAEAMRVYARQAKNREAEVDAAEIRIRAERRLGEIIAAAKEERGLAKGGQPYQGNSTPAPEEGVAAPGDGSTPPPAPPHKGEGSLLAPTLAEAGIDHKLSARAQKLAKLPEDEFAWQLSGWREKAKEEGARVSVRLLSGDAQRTKAEARAVKEEILGRRIMALPEQKFGVILADPPWRFEPWSRETGMDRAADNHYPTTGDIEGMLDVPKLAAADCVCFLWATVPMLPAALRVLDLWGFDYRSHFVWNKDRIGTGYWNRNRHELLLIGVKGNVPAPAMGTQWDSVIDAAVGKHSEKPDDFFALIESYFPTLPKIELNRRGPARPGWAAWGNEAEPGESAADASRLGAERLAPQHEGSGAEREAGDALADGGGPEAAQCGDGAGGDAAGAADRPQHQPGGAALGEAAGGGLSAPPAQKIDFEIPAFLRRAPAEARA